MSRATISIDENKLLKHKRFISSSGISNYSRFLGVLFKPFYFQRHFSYFIDANKLLNLRFIFLSPT